MTRILTISAGLSQPSSTRLLADRLTAATRSELGTDILVDTIELRDHAHAITDALITGFTTGQLHEVLQKVEEADGLILVTPTFTASYSGLFKSFIDILDPDSLRGKPVLTGATGGSERHTLVLEHAVRPLLTYLRAVVVPTSVYAASADWGNDSNLAQRIARAAHEFATVVRQQPAPTRTDEFADPVPFAQLFPGSAT